MFQILDQLRRWAEVWPLLIPLFIFVLYGNKEKGDKPIIIFVILSFFISLAMIVYAQFRSSMPYWFKGNGILYNLNSILRTLMFAWYLLQIPQVKRFKFLKVLLPVYLALVILFIFLSKSYWNIDVPTFASESILLLLLCLTYFLSSILDDESNLSLKNPVTLICIGISFFEAMNFFFYLFIYALSNSNHNLGYITMQISQYSFILFCLLLGIAFYLNRLKKNNMPNGSLEMS